MEEREEGGKDRRNRGTPEHLKAGDAQEQEAGLGSRGSRFSGTSADPGEASESRSQRKGMAWVDSRIRGRGAAQCWRPNRAGCGVCVCLTRPCRRPIPRRAPFFVTGSSRISSSRGSLSRLCSLTGETLREREPRREAGVAGNPFASSLKAREPRLSPPSRWLFFCNRTWLLG